MILYITKKNLTNCGNFTIGIAILYSTVWQWCGGFPVLFIVLLLFKLVNKSSFVKMFVKYYVKPIALKIKINPEFQILHNFQSLAIPGSSNLTDFCFCQITGGKFKRFKEKV